MEEKKTSKRKIRDITNERFGHLTALYPDPEARKNKSVLWHCKCDCGNERLETAHNLITAVSKGLSPHCGCMDGKEGYSRKAHFEGQRFGSLTVVRRTDETTSSGERIWECKCDCGNTIYLISSQLKKRKHLHCGCKGSFQSGPVKDVTGETFGYLKAIKLIEVRPTDGAIWEFECTCKKHVERSLKQVRDTVRLGYKPSCGCKRRRGRQKELR